MGKRHRYTHEELQRDEIAESLQGILDGARRHRTMLIAGVVLVVLASVVFSLTRSNAIESRRDANFMLDRAMTAYSEFSRVDDPAARAEKLEALLTTLNEFHQEHEGTALGQEALFLKGSAHYRADQFVEAQKAYQAYIDSTDDAEKRARGEIALAYAHENESFFLEEPEARVNKLRAAESHYDLAQRSSPKPSYLYYYAQLGRARIMELTRRNAEAIAAYEQVIAERATEGLVGNEESTEEEGSIQNPMIEAARTYLAELEENQPLTFASTAKFRLERLKAMQAIETPAGDAAGTPAGGAAETPNPAGAPG